MNRARVLIVENEARTRRAVSALLRLEGYRVRSSATLAEAQTAVTRAKPDVVLLDVGLGDENGYSLLGAIDACPKRPAVLVYSGREGFDDALESVRHGADGFVGKSWGVRRLLDAIAAQVGSRP